jgi:predicted AlkP superfamily pyrophosphatase or phosphodiesterase
MNILARLRSLVVFLLFTAVIAFTVSCNNSHKEVARPKLVIGIVVDQMRWDYLYRFYGRYSKDGFRRLLSKGYECRQTSINYLPSYTAPGHACIYTGSVPSIHGIAGNDWYDAATGVAHYCVDDTSVKATGDKVEGYSMSPANLLTTTITDELRLATNFRSRVYGVSLKDRGSILPAGHLANAAYWYNDKTGNFISSTYYKNPNPQWLQTFNKRRVGDSLVQLGWDLLYKPESYINSTADASPYEGPFKWETTPTFPRRFDTLTPKTRNTVLKSIPAGNTYSIMMAKACIEGEKLGKSGATDFLTLSLSSTDYIGHRFAPNSVEIEDTYLRLDKDIAELLQYLDKKYGKNNYLLFLTADHGAAHNPQFLTDNNVPAGASSTDMTVEINSYLSSIYGLDSIVTFTDNYQICLNESLFTRYTLSRPDVRSTIMKWLKASPEVAYVIDLENQQLAHVPEPIRSMVINGYHVNRSGGIQIILRPGWFNGQGHTTGTTHGTWNPYDAHIPLLWYGWHVPHGATSMSVNMTDIAPTLADMLHLQMPNGCIGKPIQPLLDAQHNKKRKNTE